MEDKAAAITALKKSLAMWEWMLRTGGDKLTYFKKIDEKNIPSQECYLCEYTCQVTGIPDAYHCEYCPVTPKEWSANNPEDREVEDDIEFESDGLCTYDGNPYYIYRYEDKRQGIMDTIAAMKLALKRLTNE